MSGSWTAEDIPKPMATLGAPVAGSLPEVASLRGAFDTLESLEGLDALLPVERLPPHQHGSGG